MKKRLTFGFLPWMAAAGVCVVGGFVRGEDAATSVPADGSVLVGGADAAAAAPAEAAVIDGAAADACMKTVKVWKMVPEIREVESTEWATEVRERSFTVTKKVPRIEERTRNYTVMVPEQRTKSVDLSLIHI